MYSLRVFSLIPKLGYFLVNFFSYTSKIYYLTCFWLILITCSIHIKSFLPLVIKTKVRYIIFFIWELYQNHQSVMKENCIGFNKVLVDTRLRQDYEKTDRILSHWKEKSRILEITVIMSFVSMNIIWTWTTFFHNTFGGFCRFLIKTPLFSKTFVSCNELCPSFL